MHTLDREHQQDAEAEAREMSANMLAIEFLAALRGDLSAPAMFAPRITDWSAEYLPGIAQRPKRYQSVSELAIDHLNNKPEFTALVNLLVDMAYGADDRSVMAHKARELINTIAYQFGDNNFEESAE